MGHMEIGVHSKARPGTKSDAGLVRRHPGFQPGLSTPAVSKVAREWVRRCKADEVR
jgi:hypothetical protein